MMGRKRDYKDLIVWQKADKLYHLVADEVEKFPKNLVAWRISIQLLDSAGSISTNIAEGYGRGRSREFKQYFRQARGSLIETDNWLYKAVKRGFISSSRYQGVYTPLIEEIGKLITTWIGKLSTQVRKI
jgi:four helix bundle protein